MTSEPGAETAKKHGITVLSTFTGFQFIGEKITRFKQAKPICDEACDYEFIIGYAAEPTKISDKFRADAWYTGNFYKAYSDIVFGHRGLPDSILSH